MVARDIQHFSESRVKIRAYFCYLFSKNLPNRLPAITPEAITARLLKIKGDLADCEGVYLLDERGVQVSPTFLKHGQLDEDAGRIRSDRAYYYRAMREKRCTITDPYPSLISNELCVTASQPIFDENGHIRYVACLDMPLGEVLRIAHPTAMSSLAGKFFRYAYAAFTVALAMVALLLFVKGVEAFVMYGADYHALQINDIFEATILLTLSLAIFDLVKTLYEEEVMGKHRESGSFDTHKTMVRFLGSIIIALSIEALMLVFKFAITEPDKLIDALFIITGVFMLLAGMSMYLKNTNRNNQEG